MNFIHLVTYLIKYDLKKSILICTTSLDDEDLLKD